MISAIEITEQVNARQELERLDRLKDEFLSLASHELRTPLTPLMGYTSILTEITSKKENEPGWDSRISEVVGKFHKQLDYIAHLVDDLFDVARLQSGKLSLERKQVDLVTVLEQAIETARMLTPKHTIELEVEPARLLCWGTNSD